MEEQRGELVTEEVKEEQVTLTYKQIIELTEHAAKVGAKEALQFFRDEKKKEQENRGSKKLRNTKLLLRNYHVLKAHAENAIFDRISMNESPLDVLEELMMQKDNDVLVDSIKRSATRTAIIISHIDTMLDLYEVYCDKANNRELEMRRYNTIYDMYLSETRLTAKDIAEKNNISKESVYADLNAATAVLSGLIFGADGINIK